MLNFQKMQIIIYHNKLSINLIKWQNKQKINVKESGQWKIQSNLKKIQIKVNFNKLNIKNGKCGLIM
jgi:hypothetical protein